MKCDKIDRLSRLFTQPGTNVIFFWVGNLFEGFYSNGISGQFYNKNGDKSGKSRLSSKLRQEKYAI